MMTAAVSQTSERAGEVVDRIYDLVSLEHQRFRIEQRRDDDPRWERGEGAVEINLPAVIKPRGRFGRAVIPDISSRGLQASSSIAVREGELVLIKIGRWGTDQYSFPCRVCRVAPGGVTRLTLRFNGPPLRVRSPR